jgi:asparagine synthase (glutamine-hydrolysing)
VCGIAGYLHYEQQRSVDPVLVSRMLQAISHRGPDDQGVYCNRNVGIGARRLSIIDLDGGHQPVSNEDASCWVAYNGEVYNFLLLRRELIARGHTFKTLCDTEVIVHAYEEYGLDFVRHFNGMFAFALWDGSRQRLILARDRIGIKPLYYAETDRTLIFASEVKSILQYPGFHSAANPNSLDNLLTFEYNPDQNSLFFNVKKVPAGHLAIIERGALRLQRYWDLKESSVPPPTLAEAVAGVRDKLTQAVSSHLMSDVPLGVFLSGGMDSSSIVALMSQMHTGAIKTFSIGFSDGEDYNELEFARQVAQHFHTDHHEYVLEPKVVDTIPHLIWHLEEPIADEAALPLYHLSSMAKEHVKVVLVGDGGDETFAGYNRYFVYRHVGLYTRLPRLLRKGLVEPMVGALPLQPGNGLAATLTRRAKKLVEVAYQPEEIRFSTWNRVLSDEVKAQIYSKEYRDLLDESRPFERHRQFFADSMYSDPISRSQYVDIKTYLVDCLLLKSDKVTSAFSLECRVPFLDGPLLEYVMSLPAHYKYRGRQTKSILREAMRGLLPDPIRLRKKQGFILPFGRWFKNGLLEFAREILLDSRSRQRGYFDSGGLERLLSGRQGMDDRSARAIYALLTFEFWNRMFIDRPVASRISATVSESAP